jgi:hypothetical protein
MGFAREGVWVMGYCRLMGYGMHFPAHQVGGQAELWDIRGYGLSEVWVMTGSTVLTNSRPHRSANRSLDVFRGYRRKTGFYISRQTGRQQLLPASNGIQPLVRFSVLDSALQRASMITGLTLRWSQRELEQVQQHR